jgi:hypothetical protein
MHTSSQLLLGTVLLLVSGCAVTIKDFRETPLMVLAKVPGRHEPTANCVMLRLEETADTWPDTFRITTEGSRTSLLISRSPSGPLTLTPSPLAEIIFTESKSKDLLVESRFAATSTAEYYLDHVKPLMVNCGRQSLAEESANSVGNVRVTRPGHRHLPLNLR